MAYQPRAPIPPYVYNPDEVVEFEGEEYTLPDYSKTPTDNVPPTGYYPPEGYAPYETPGPYMGGDRTPYISGTAAGIPMPGQPTDGSAGGPVAPSGEAGGSEGYPYANGALAANFYTSPGPFAYDPFKAPPFDQPAFPKFDPFGYEAFAAPTLDEARADPGFDFRLKEGQRMIENAKSAQGMLASGPTAKALMQWGQDLADTTYGNVFNRKFQGWQANRGAAAEDYDRNLGNLYRDYGVKYGAETDEFNRSLEDWKANFGAGATDYGFKLDVASGLASGLQAATAEERLRRALDLSANSEAFAQAMALYQLATEPIPFPEF